LRIRIPELVKISLTVLLIVTILQQPSSTSASGPNPIQVSNSTEAYFRFTDATPSTFVIRLTDPTTIQQARDILAGKYPLLKSIIGSLIKSPAPYNPPWRYYLNSSTIQFAEITVEVCQANIQDVQDHLSEVGGAFLPNNVWCPGARLLQELSFSPTVGGSTVPVNRLALLAPHLGLMSVLAAAILTIAIIRLKRIKSSPAGTSSTDRDCSLSV